MKGKTMSDTPRTDKHVADIGADGLADGDFARSLERDLAAAQARVERLRHALGHVVWIKDGGIDATDEHGVFRNHPDAERDAMYRIAKDALAEGERHEQ